MTHRNPSYIHPPPGTDETARKVLDLLLPLRREDATHGHDIGRCFAPQIEQIGSFVHDGEPLLFTLPSFPCKSPNPAKVLGHLPDYGELLALRSLQKLCVDIAAVYRPGARMLICSDGHVFADVVRVSDERVTEYISDLRDMIELENLDRLAIYNLDDVYGPIDYERKRQLMLAEYGQSLESLRAEVKSDDRSLRMYRGITRFMVEDAHGPGLTLTKSALLKEARQQAYRVIQRSRAWSELVDHRIRRSVRLSIHPQACGTPKFGIRLLDIPDSWMTPWHSVAVRYGGRVVLMKRHQADQLGHLVIVDGRPSHYVAKEASPDFIPDDPSVNARAS
jgi:L-tyrosine isonitrile synthase